MDIILGISSSTPPARLVPSPLLWPLSDPAFLHASQLEQRAADRVLLGCCGRHVDRRGAVNRPASTIHDARQRPDGHAGESRQAGGGLGRAGWLSEELEFELGAARSVEVVEHAEAPASAQQLDQLARLRRVRPRAHAICRAQPLQPRRRRITRAFEADHAASSTHPRQPRRQHLPVAKVGSGDDAPAPGQQVDQRWRCAGVATHLRLQPSATRAGRAVGARQPHPSGELARGVACDSSLKARGIDLAETGADQGQVRAHPAQRSAGARQRCDGAQRRLHERGRHERPFEARQAGRAQSTAQRARPRRRARTGGLRLPGLHGA